MLKRLLFIFAFLIAFTNYAQSGFEIKKNRNKVVIPFKLINNLVFIPIKLNGEELTFLLDTGVEETILFSVNDNSELTLNNVEVIKLKGLGNSDAINGYKSSKNEINIKQFVDSNHSLYIVLDQEFNFSSQVGIPVNGILGYHFFKNNLVKIDYSKRKIYVYKKGHKVYRQLLNTYKKDSLIIDFNKPYVFETITNKGVKKYSKLLIDSGNSESVWVFNKDKVLIPMSDHYLEDFLGRGFNGDVFGKRSRIEQIEFGGHQFKEVITNFPDSISTKSVNLVDHRVGSIGGEILSRFTLFFDYPNNVMYTKPNVTVDEPFNFNMSGIEVEHTGLQWIKEEYSSAKDGITIYTNTRASDYGTINENYQNSLKTRFSLVPVFKILSVRPNSEAEIAGLKRGDKIISINNKNADRLSIQKIHELLKSGEGRTIQMKVERNGIEMKIKFQLKKVL